MSLKNRTAAHRRGRFAETLCTLYLRMAGWKILARGHKGIRGTGAGEVDIIARRGKTLAFVEVKARASMTEAIHALTPAQQSGIVRAAEAYLQTRPDLAAYNIRFDVLALDGGLWPKHIPDAWRP